MANEKDLGTDAFGGKLPEKTSEEITRDIERILNYRPKSGKEEPTLEDSVKPSTPIQQYTFKDVLMNIGRKHYAGNNFLTPSELDCELLGLGAKKLEKGAGMGFFRGYATKTLDELANILYELGGVSSVQEGKRIVPNIVDMGIRVYGSGYSWEIKEVINAKNQKNYSIRRNGLG